MTPTKRILLIGAIAVLIVAALAYFLIPGKASAPTTAPTATSQPGLPSAGTAPLPAGSTTGAQTPTMTVAGLAGSAIATKDFLHDGVTQEDPQNPGTYYLAGAAGYCLKNGTCPGGATSTEYHVVYNATDQAFYISLLKEPLGQARTDAEQFMETALGVPPAELCQLKYFLSTTSYVNPQYAGQNLLFSFCPNATTLP